MEDFCLALVSGICLGGIYALVALGYTLVYGIIGLINFAHGEFYMVGAYAGYGFFLLLPDGTSAYLAIPVVVLAGGMAGAAIAGATEWIAYKPIRKQGRLAALLTAIGVSLLLQQGFAFINNAQPLKFPMMPTDPALPPESTVGGLAQMPVRLFGGGIYAIRFVFLGATVLLTGGLWYLVQWTRFGKAMRAVSQDRDAAALMGIDTDSIIRRTFLLGGFLAGVAGVLVALQADVEPMMGFKQGLKAFSAAVVGGIGSIPGAVLGGFLIGIVEELAPWAGVPTAYKDVTAFVMLIGVLVLRPQGLLGKVRREKV